MQGSRFDNGQILEQSLFAGRRSGTRRSLAAAVREMHRSDSTKERVVGRIRSFLTEIAPLPGARLR